MFQPVTRAGASVREGDVSARELVEASLQAIDRLNGELNAFVTLCDERALAEADAIEPGDSRPLAGIPIAIKDLVALTEGVRTTMGMAPWRTGCRRWTARSCAACARPARSSSARPTRPSWASSPSPSRSASGPPATPGTRLARRAAPRAAAPRRWRPAWSRSRTRTTAAGRSASPRRAAGSWASSRAAGGCRSRRSSPSSPARIAIDGCVSRTVADTALMLDVISGYEPGDPYWAPDPSAPFVEAVGAQPGHAAHRVHDRSPHRRAGARGMRRGRGETAELLESLGHTVDGGADVRATSGTSRTSSRSGPPESRTRCARTAGCAGSRSTSTSSSRSRARWSPSRTR